MKSLQNFPDFIGSYMIIKFDSPYNTNMHPTKPKLIPDAIIKAYYKKFI